MSTISDCGVFLVSEPVLIPVQSEGSMQSCLGQKILQISNVEVGTVCALSNSLNIALNFNTMLERRTLQLNEMG